MLFREAVIPDILQIQVVRHAVKENILSNPALVTDKDCEEYMTQRGKGWVCEIEGAIVGFSIVDLQDNNVWALFVDPAFAGKGIGKQLHQLALQWYFSQTSESLWLGTEPNTKADKFYRLQGWQADGMHGSNEIKFIMTKNQWMKVADDS